MSFARFIERWASLRPEHPALRFQGRSLSYAALWQRIDAATPALARELGVRRGDRVAYLGYNDPELVVLLFALARLGAMLVPLNFRLAGPELAGIVDHADADVLIADPDFAASVAAIRAARPAVRLVSTHAARDGTAWPERLDTPLGPPLSPPLWSAITRSGAPAVDEGGNDALPMMIVYTSGTTGKAKGAVHTQEGMLWNIVCATHAQDLNVHDRVLMGLPMFHVGGLCIQTLPALHAGATVSIEARFDPGAWLRDVAAEQATVSLLVPATVRAILEHPQWPAADLSSLRLLNMGSSVVPSQYIEAFIARGVTVVQVYGATETGPVSIALRPEDASRKIGSAGKPALHCDVRLVDNQGRDVPRGEVGELWLRAKNMMQGYWKDPHNPAFQDHWFHSGDLARIDEDGFYWVVGRSKDMIISGGENIYPAEIENVLAACPDVLECAVLGQPDPKWGEVAVAVIVRVPNSTLTREQVLTLFEGRIARFKHPRHIHFVEALPKTALGKIQKSGLLQALGLH